MTGRFGNAAGGRLPQRPGQCITYAKDSYNTSNVLRSGCCRQVVSEQGVPLYPSYMGRFPVARGDLVFGGHVAALYPACSCKHRLLTLMESADPLLISSAGFLP